jgi:hypothetical protein
MPNVSSATELASVQTDQPNGAHTISPSSDGDSRATKQPSTSDKKATVAKQYKSVPQNWTALPESRFRQVITHLESVLLEISSDGNNVNIPEGPITPATLNRWAGHLRAALKALTTGR